jgi:hypothetical protein
LPLMVNNIGYWLVAILARKNLKFFSLWHWMTNIAMHITNWLHDNGSITSLALDNNSITWKRWIFYIKTKCTSFKLITNKKYTYTLIFVFLNVGRKHWEATQYYSSNMTLKRIV